MQVGIPVAYNVCEVKLDKINYWIRVHREDTQLVLRIDRPPETLYRVTVPYAACIQRCPPEDEHVMLETCRGE